MELKPQLVLESLEVKDFPEIEFMTKLKIPNNRNYEIGGLVYSLKGKENHLAVVQYTNRYKEYDHYVIKRNLSYFLKSIAMWLFGYRIAGTWHSHASGQGHLSPTDVSSLAKVHDILNLPVSWLILIVYNDMVGEDATLYIWKVYDRKQPQ